jgi:hypothetical protein
LGHITTASFGVVQKVGEISRRACQKADTPLRRIAAGHVYNAVRKSSFINAGAAGVENETLSLNRDI